MSAHNFFMVTPFAMQVRAWCARQQQKRKISKRQRRKGHPESSDEDIDDIPPCHSIYASPKKTASESRKSAIQRRMQSRTSRISNIINMADSSDDEVIAEKANSQSTNKVRFYSLSADFYNWERFRLIRVPVQQSVFYVNIFRRQKTLRERKA